MPLKVVRKLSKFDVMGALKVKYFGVSVGALLVMLILAFRFDLAGVRARFKGLYDMMLQVPVLKMLVSG